MKTALLTALALSLATPALAKDKNPPPPAPATEPDWAAVRAKAEALMKRQLFDPGSAQFAWTEGFRWGYTKRLLGSKTYQWVACGTLNAKNRLGGYVGAKPFYAAVSVDGTVEAESESLVIDSCNFSRTHVDPQPALLDKAGAHAAVPSVADELMKLAELRDKGVITQAEFDQQKAKLLSR